MNAVTKDKMNVKIPHVNNSRRTADPSRRGHAARGDRNTISREPSLAAGGSSHLLSVRDVPKKMACACPPERDARRACAPAAYKPKEPTRCHVRRQKQKVRMEGDGIEPPSWQQSENLQLDPFRSSPRFEPQRCSAADNARHSSGRARTARRVFNL